MIVVPLGDLKNQRIVVKRLSQIVSHELGHRFCFQNFPEDINKKAMQWNSKSNNLQEKMMNLFSGMNDTKYY